MVLGIKFRLWVSAASILTHWGHVYPQCLKLPIFSILLPTCDRQWNAYQARGSCKASTGGSRMPPVFTAYIPCQIGTWTSTQWLYMVLCYFIVSDLGDNHHSVHLELSWHRKGLLWALSCHPSLLPPPSVEVASTGCRTLSSWECCISETMKSTALWDGSRHPA